MFAMVEIGMFSSMSLVAKVCRSECIPCLHLDKLIFAICA